MLIHHGVQPRHRIPQQAPQLVKGGVDAELHLLPNAQLLGKRCRQAGRQAGETWGDVRMRQAGSCRTVADTSSVRHIMHITADGQNGPVGVRN